jgi:hypothetical protein
MNKRELRQQQQEQLMEAYERLNGRTAAEVRKNIYKSLTYFWLYEEPPESFTEAIQYGEEYVNNPRLLPSGGIWVNLASAYAQKAGWLMRESGTAEPDTALRQLVIKAIEQAVRLDDTWILQFQLLLRSDHPLKTGPDAEKYKGENELEIFETDEETRALIGLPPKRREVTPAAETKVASNPPEEDVPNGRIKGLE